jgi:hypothetical protein
MLGTAARGSERDRLREIAQNQCVPHWLRDKDPAPCISGMSPPHAKKIEAFSATPTYETSRAEAVESLSRLLIRARVPAQPVDRTPIQGTSNRAHDKDAPRWPATLTGTSSVHPQARRRFRRWRGSCFDQNTCTLARLSRNFRSEAGRLGARSSQQ